MIAICPATRLHEVIPIGLRFFKYANEKGVPNVACWLNYWSIHYQNGTGLLLVEENNGEICGFYGMVIAKEPWTGDLVANEVCWYSEGSGGVRMLKMALQIAKEAGVKLFYAHHLNNQDNERLKKLYNKMGFELSYFKYTREL